MRKYIAALIALILLAGTCAGHAEEQFTLRGGLHWGMSIEEAKALEGDPGEYSEYELTPDSLYLHYDDEQGKTVSLFLCEMDLYFKQDMLYMVKYSVGYNWYELDVIQQYLYLMNALTSLYGPGHSPSYEETIKAITAMEPYYEGGDIAADEFERLTMWDLPQSTTVLMGFRYNRLFIAYYSFGTLLTLMPADGVYNTDGL